MFKATILFAVCAAFVLLPSISATSTTTPTQSLPFQSWSCVSTLDDHPAGASVFFQAVPTNTPVNEGPNRASKFLYNLVWGPPNPFMVQLGLPSTLDTLTSAAFMPTYATTQWSANITSTIPNGFPMGCCNMTFGSLSVAELGCRFCINPSTSSLPLISSTNTDAIVKANQRLSCATTGANGLAIPAGTVTCAQTTYIPGFKTDVWSGQTNTGLVTQGTGVSTLMFPSSGTGVLAGGIYTFQLWAESLCGVAKSKDVTLAARCPPSPVVSAVVRTYAGGSVSTPSTTITFPYTVSTGNKVVVDASCSYPYLIQKPNWPSGQPGFTYTGPSTSADATATAFFGARNLYAIQKIYFNAGDAQTTVDTASVQANSAYFTTSPMQDYWATTVSFSTQGAHNVFITVTDGCSAGQAYVTITAQCTCIPVAKAAFVPTIWSNEIGGPSTNQFNSAITAGTATIYNLGPVTDRVTGVLGSASATYGFSLSATGFDFEEAATPSNLAYDWSFVSWAPDFSTTAFSANGVMQSLAAMHLPGTFPPSAATACTSALTGRPPIQCATGNNFNWGLTATQCCFSTSDVITDVGAVQRPARGSYVYKVMKTLTPNVPLRQWTTAASATRAVVYDFMRLGSGCNSALPVGNDVWNSSVSWSVSAWTNPSYMMLPTYLDFSTTLPWVVANSQPQVYNDFNGFPGVNSGAANTNVFLPTTECGGWLKVARRVFTYTDTQTKFNSTVTCGANADLVICRVTIIQTPAGATNPWNTATAALSVSSFGSCRGSWTFQLAVDDSCNTATDIFTVKVGCNRAPIVSAGCINSQTWTRSSGGAQQFQQISLDGRATFDPDNFVDSFNGLNGGNNGGVFPACLAPGLTNACDNGGLGLHGLTYAWALISFVDSNGINQYNTTSRLNCPTTTPNMQATCAQTYCTGQFAYPFVSLYTQMYDVTKFQTGTIGTNALMTSLQGASTLIEAWGTGFFAVNSQLVSAPNTLPVYNAGGTSMTKQPIFPDFNANCAPTVFPMFVTAFTQTNGGTYNAGVTAASWDYAEQLAHTGNSAFMAGLTKAGSYRVRLYAFDGCSVGMGDVTFVTECPSMTFSSAAADVFWNINSTAATFNSGDVNYGYTPPFMQVNYGGTNDIVITVTVTVMKQNTPQSYTPTAFTCSFAQQSGTVPSGYRVMTPTVATSPAIGCNNFLSQLSPGTYALQAVADDQCVRGSVVTSVMSNPFVIACPANVVATAGVVGQSPANRLLAYTLPTGNAGQGTFPNFVFNITARATVPGNPALDYNGGKVAISYTVYWKPTNLLTTNIVPNDATGMGGNLVTVRNAFFQNTAVAGLNVPLATTFNVFTVPLAVNPYYQTLLTLNGGTKFIQYPSSTPAILNNLVATGLVYNTATDAGQVNFNNPATRNTFGILWAGDYYIGFTGDAANLAGNGVLGCGSSFQALDQFFQVTCAAPNDPVGSLSGSNLWTGTTTPYFGAAPFSTPGAAATFRTVTLFGGSSGNAGPIDNTFFQGQGTASSVSYLLSYRLPFTMAPNATADITPTIPTVPVQFLTVYQNPLLIQPLGSALSSFQTPRYGNAWNQDVQLTMPGTWRISTFATNGCSNVTGSSIDLQAYCYDATLPQATLKLTVRANVQGCTTAPVTNDANYGNYCDVTALAIFSCTASVRAVRGPLLKGTNSFFRRRLLSEEEEQQQQEGETSGSRRHLLQTATIGAALCTENGNGLAAPSPPAAFTSPMGGTVSTGYTYTAGAAGSYSVATTMVLSPNWQALATVYYNSFDITPSYTPSYVSSTGDLRNFYGMGDLFGDGALKFGIGGNNIKKYYQGAFDGLTITPDLTTPLGTGRVFTSSNNNAYSWFNLNTWSSTYTVSSANAPSWVPASSPNAAFSNLCSWQPVSTLIPNSASAGYNGQAQMNMTLVGCSQLGASVPLAGNVAAATAQYAAGTFGNPPELVVTARGISGQTTPASGRPSNLFGVPMANPSFATRKATLEGNYDFQLIVWNGPVGASCYDYRAVRVRAICNRLVPGVSGGRSSATEGPIMYAATASTPLPSTWTGVAAVPTVAVSWNLGAFDTVNLLGIFQYLQCGAGPAMPTGTASDNCGSQYGSFNGEGNYFSLSVTWSVVSAPIGSVFYVGNAGIVNDTVSSITYGNTVTLGNSFSIVDPQDSTRTINYQYYQRTNTWTMPQYQTSIVLLNHGYKYPTTSFRPDVAGSYSIQLSLDDGCSSWTGSAVTITSSCADFSALGLFSNIVQVNVAGSNTAITAGTAVNGVSQYAIGIDGSTYQRITMSVDPAVPAGYYFTYKWTVTQVGGSAVMATNMQGNVASFIPEPLSGDATNNVNTFTVQLQILTNCLTGIAIGGVTQAQTLTFTASIVVTCSLTVTQDNFRFFTPYVSSWSSNTVLPNYWGVATAGAPTFISTISNANSATQLYYAQNRVLGNLGVTSQVTNPINCDPTGPYCGPFGTGTQTVPTILFGGSVPPVAPGFTAAVGSGWSTINNWVVTNGVTGAHFQGLYFSVPATLTANLCKIKQTYWVLSGYQNALPFVPDFVPARTVNNVTLCTPQQVWSWTVTATPCQTCANSLDVCDLDPYYQYQTVLVNNQYNSGYAPPAFYTINQANAATNGQLISGFCVYASGQRLSGLPNNANLIQNCAVSGRGSSVIVSQTGTSQAAQTAGGVSQGMAYPMDQIAFVPSFPGAYNLDLNVFDGCGPAVTATVTINAMCRKTPTITQLKTTTNAYYYCSDTNNGGGNYGVPTTGGVNGVAKGKFEPVYLNTIVAASGISNTDATVAAPVRRQCQVQAAVSTWNCTDVKNYVNSQNIAVDTSASAGNQFKACCTCLYGTQVININSGTTSRSAFPAAASVSSSSSFAASTQQNILALSDAEYNKNYIFLIAIVTPLAVLLVASLAGNVLMLLKVRSAVAAPAAREIEFSPRARVDV